MTSGLVTFLRWIAVVPAFLAAAVFVGCGSILLVYLTSSVAIFNWFMIPAEEYIQFWRASDMSGSYLSGTIWLLLTYSFAFVAGISAAIRVAPSHEVQTAWVLTGLTALVLSVGLLASMHQPLSFSTWYRAIAEAACILIGCGGGIKEAVVRYGT